MATQTTATSTLDRTFSALADPTRLEMVRRLSRGGASVSELGEPFAMSLRGVLKHVQILEDAGLVSTHKSGRVRRCELERDRIDAAAQWMEQLRRRWERRLDRLEKYRAGTGEAMTDNTTLRLERLIDAPPDVVFRVWSTRDAMEVWYRDGDDYVARVTELDLRVGGRYRVEFGPEGQPPYVETGVYLKIDPPRRLVMSETLEGVDSSWANTKVTVVFEEQDGKTHLVLVHEGFPSQELRDLAGGGWPGFLDRVERLIAAGGGR